MSARSRQALALLGALVLLAAGLTIARPASDDAKRATGAGAGGPTTGASQRVGVSDGAVRERPDPGPLLTAGKLVEIEVERGDVVRLRARSETGDELHVHGYDIARELPAGRVVNVRFVADIEGVFEIELHGSGEQVGELTVNP